MEARHVGGMCCGFVDLITFFFVHLVLLRPGCKGLDARRLCHADRAVTSQISQITQSSLHLSLISLHSTTRAREIVDVKGWAGL
jgi:hypothetical protein